MPCFVEVSDELKLIIKEKLCETESPLLQHDDFEDGGEYSLEDLTDYFYDNKDSLSEPLIKEIEVLKTGLENNCEEYFYLKY